MPAQKRKLLDAFLTELCEESRNLEPAKDEPTFISINQAMKRFSLSRPTLSRKIKSGDITASKLSNSRSGKILIEVKSVIEYLEKMKIGGAR